MDILATNRWVLDIIEVIHSLLISTKFRIMLNPPEQGLHNLKICATVAIWQNRTILRRAVLTSENRNGYAFIWRLRNDTMNHLIRLNR